MRLYDISMFILFINPYLILFILPDILFIYRRLYILFQYVIIRFYKKNKYKDILSHDDIDIQAKIKKKIQGYLQTIRDNP